jgi:hypothetical protein
VGKKINVDLFSNDIGFGDTVSRAIKTVTRGKIKECGGCKKRRDILNRMIPYRNATNRG